MPTSGINLIPELTEKELRNSANKSKANRAAIITLVIIGVIVLALILYRIFLGFQTGSVADQERAAEAKIANYRDVEVSQLTLAQKLTQARTILQQALPGSVALAEVTDAAVKANTIILKHVVLNDSGTLTIDGLAPNSTIFASWIDNLTTGDAAKDFSRINLVSMVRNELGYNFSMLMEFNERGLLK